MTDLADALDLSLECGELVQLCGGHTTRTVDTMERMARALGAQQCHAAISSINVAISVTADGHTLSAGRHAGHLGINFSTLTAIKHLVQDTEDGRLGAAEVRRRLDAIRGAPPVYPPWLVMVMLGGSGAAFAALFGAGATAIALVLASGWAGGWTRFLLVRRHQPPFVSVGSAAFVAAFVVAVGAHLLGLSAEQTSPALAASTLFLVPGVPLLNGTADLLTTHYLNGLVKLAMSAVIVASAAVGRTVAVTLAGVLP
jgi:uncharacterized membrane protein YjjP (DUF1212 family)